MLIRKWLAPRLDTLTLPNARGAAVDFYTHFIWLWHWSAIVSPPSDLQGKLGRLHFLLLGLRNQSALDPFVKAPGNGALGRAVRSRPQMLGIVMHAYQTTARDLPTRLDAVVQHFNELVKLKWSDLNDPDMSLEIMKLTEIEPGLRLVLDQAPWFCSEGPLVLNLFDGEERLYSLAFALHQKGGLVTAQVGAIQGRALPGILDVYRRLTRASYGLRPRDLLIELFRLFCASIDVRQILLVSDSHRQHRDAYFESTADAVVADYDAIWRERGAHFVDDATFELPLTAIRRAVGDRPARKRALYCRRYELLDVLAARMEERIPVMRGTPALLEPA